MLIKWCLFVSASFFFSLISFHVNSKNIDPTKPYYKSNIDEEIKVKKIINVQGVVKIKDIYKVFIDGKTYYEKDSVNSFFINKITHDYVELLNNGATKKIWISKKVALNDRK